MMELGAGHEQCMHALEWAYGQVRATHKQLLHGSCAYDAHSCTVREYGYEYGYGYGYGYEYGSL
eukprot:27601-Pelagomonas_calceolata.AAC.1